MTKEKDKSMLLKIMTICFVILLGICGQGCSKIGEQTGDIQGNGSEAQTYESQNLPTIVADQSSEDGIDPSTSFTIDYPDAMTVSDIKSLVQVDPDKDFDIQQLSDTTYQLSFQESLPEDTIIKMKIAYEDTDYGYAFQTEDDLRLKSVYPADESTAVAKNSSIEWTFSKTLDTSIEDHVRITPETAGRYKISGKKLIFIPATYLETGTTYTLTIDDTYVLNDEALDSSITSFTTASDTDIYLGDNTINQVSADSQQLLSYRNYGDEEDDEYTLSVYKIDALEDLSIYSQTGYVNVMEALKNIGEDTVYKTMKASRVSSGDQYENQLLFEESLEVGMYYVTLDGQGTFVQVTNYTAYMTLDDKMLLLWVQDEGGGSLVGELSEDGNLLGTSDESGLLTLDYEGEAGDHTYVLKMPNQSLVFVMDTQEAVEDSNKDYFSEIHTDRPIYLPSDSIYFTGMAIARKGENLDSVTVRFDQVTDEYEDEGIEAMSPVTLDLTDQGTFTGNVSFTDYEDDYLHIAVYDGDTLLTSIYVEVYAFEKPKLTISSGLDEHYVQVGESTSLESYVSYFDGMPASQSGVNLDIYGNQVEFFDEEGNNLDGASLDGQDGYSQEDIYPASEDVSDQEWEPTKVRVTTSPDDLDNYYVEEENHFLFFPKIFMLEGQAISESQDQSTIQGCLSTIDLTGLREKESETDESNLDFSPDPEDYRGESLEGYLIQASVSDTWYTKVEIGSSYDPVTKTNQKSYKWEKNEETINLGNFTTDSQGYVEVTFDGKEEGHSYTMELEYTDDDPDKDVIESIRLSSSGLLYDNEDGYALQTNDASSAYSQDYGEDKEWVLTQDGQAVVHSDKDKMLVLVSRDGIMDYEVLGSQTNFTVTMDQKHVPDYQVKVVYFDGSKMVSNWEMTQFVSVNEESRTLNVSLSFDQESYGPGDSVKYQVEVMDQEGDPVACDVNLSVVDEALLAIEDEKSDPVSDLYSSTYDTGILGQMLFSSQADNVNGAEGGGEGGGGTLRTSFQNTAYYTTLSVDDSGQAQGEFVLPDNLTTWRVTGIAYTKDGPQAGKTKEDIQTGLSLALSYQGLDTYGANEDVSINLCPYGDVANKEKDMNLEVSLEDDAGHEITSKSYESAYGKVTSVDFGRLDIGGYTIIAYLYSQGEMIDGVQESLEVVDNKQSYDFEDVQELTDETSFSDTLGTTHLEFYNKEVYIYENFLDRLSYKKYDNVYLKSATAEAVDNYLKIYNQEISQSDQDLANTANRYYTDSDGLVKPLMNAEGDLMTTARFLAVGGESLLSEFNLYELRQTIDDQVKEMDERGSYSEDDIINLWIREMLGDSVLLEAQSLEADYQEMDNQTKGVYIRLLTDLGETGKAKKLMEDYLQSVGIGVKNDRSVYLENDSDEDAQFALTVLIASGTEIGDEAMAQSAYEWWKDQQSYKKNSNEKVTLYYAFEPEIFLYLKDNPPAEKDVQFNYTTGDGVTAALISGKDYLELDLDKEETSKLDFSDVDEGILVVSEFKASAEGMEMSKDIQVEKTYANAKDPDDDIHVGDHVIVTIDITFSAGYDSNIEVQDIIPSGLTYLWMDTDDGVSDGLAYWLKNKGTKVNFTGEKRDYHDTYTEVEFSYEAIATMAGDFKVDPVVVGYFNNEVTYVNDSIWDSNISYGASEEGTLHVEAALED